MSRPDKCDRCGKVISEDEGVNVEGVRLCSTCYDALQRQHDRLKKAMIDAAQSVTKS